jgi:hypothetical protein
VSTEYWSLACVVARGRPLPEFIMVQAVKELQLLARRQFGAHQVSETHGGDVVHIVDHRPKSRPTNGPLSRFFIDVLMKYLNPGGAAP